MSQIFELLFEGAFLIVHFGFSLIKIVTKIVTYDPLSKVLFNKIGKAFRRDECEEE